MSAPGPVDPHEDTHRQPERMTWQAAARDAALEEAAMVAEAVSDDRPEGYDPMYWAATRDVAEAIRALKETQT